MSKEQASSTKWWRTAILTASFPLAVTAVKTQRRRRCGCLRNSSISTCTIQTHMSSSFRLRVKPCQRTKSVVRRTKRGRSNSSWRNSFSLTISLALSLMSMRTRPTRRRFKAISYCWWDTKQVRIIFTTILLQGPPMILSCASRTKMICCWGNLCKIHFRSITLRHLVATNRGKRTPWWWGFCREIIKRMCLKSRRLLRDRRRTWGTSRSLRKASGSLRSWSKTECWRTCPLSKMVRADWTCSTSISPTLSLLISTTPSNTTSPFRPLKSHLRSTLNWTTSPPLWTSLRTSSMGTSTTAWFALRSLKSLETCQGCSSVATVSVKSASGKPSSQGRILQMLVNAEKPPVSWLAQSACKSTYSRWPAMGSLCAMKSLWRLATIRGW